MKVRNVQETCGPVHGLHVRNLRMWLWRWKIKVIMYGICVRLLAAVTFPSSGTRRCPQCKTRTWQTFWNTFSHQTQFRKQIVIKYPCDSESRTRVCPSRKELKTSMFTEASRSCTNEFQNFETHRSCAQNITYHGRPEERSITHVRHKTYVRHKKETVFLR